MPKVRVCVFNRTRQSFLSLNTTVADNLVGRLKGMLGYRAVGTDHAVWLVPSHGVHTFGMMIPIDVVYLDRNFKVLDIVENVGPFRMTPFRAEAASVLELPVRTIYASQTRRGDEISIWSPHHLKEVNLRSQVAIENERSDRVRQVASNGAS